MFTGCWQQNRRTGVLSHARFSDDQSTPPPQQKHVGVKSSSNRADPTDFRRQPLILPEIPPTPKTEGMKYIKIYETLKR